jgi:hypothetical protein
VESRPFWKQFPKATLVVSAVGDRTDPYKYPQLDDRKLLREQVSVMFVSGRTAQFCNLGLLIARTLARGEDVVMHCNQSFHRGPVLAAATMWHLFGVEPKAVH